MRRKSVVPFLAAALVGVSAPAFADPGFTQDLVNAACSNNGALLVHGIAAISSISVVASFIANFRSKIPAPVMWYVDKIALNWVRTEAQAAATPPTKPEWDTTKTS
jgi:hypothetical protein